MPAPPPVELGAVVGPGVLGAAVGSGVPVGCVVAPVDGVVAPVVGPVGPVGLVAGAVGVVGVGSVAGGAVGVVLGDGLRDPDDVGADESGFCDGGDSPREPLPPGYCGAGWLCEPPVPGSKTLP